MSRATENQSTWQLQTAKARFSKVVKRAVECGPQLVTKTGRPAVYIISAELFDLKFRRDRENRKTVLLESPHQDLKLDLSRDQDEGGEIEL